MVRWSRLPGSALAAAARTLREAPGSHPKLFASVPRQPGALPEPSSTLLARLHRQRRQPVLHLFGDARLTGQLAPAAFGLAPPPPPPPRPKPCCPSCQPPQSDIRALVLTPQDRRVVVGRLARAVLSFQDTFLSRESSPAGLLCQVRPAAAASRAAACVPGACCLAVTAVWPWVDASAADVARHCLMIAGLAARGSRRQ